MNFIELFARMGDLERMQIIGQAQTSAAPGHDFELKLGNFVLC